jgi:general secretion pathway protein K
VQGFRRRRRRLSPSSERPSGRRRPAERGFVLIAAIWLLILAGSITAVLMLRALSAATAASGHGDAIERRLALESAIETMLADRLFNGRSSAWHMVPARGAIAIDGREIHIRLTSDSGRLDVNMADPALIDTALQGFGVAAAERGAIVTRLLALRARKKRIGSAAELDRLLAGASRGAGVCLAEHFTWVSGLAEPRAEQVSRALARALGGRGGAFGDDRPGEPEGGSGLRVEASDAGGAAMLAIVHIAGLPEQPVLFSAWGPPFSCAGPERATS